MTRVAGEVRGHSCSLFRHGGTVGRASDTAFRPSTPPQGVLVQTVVHRPRLTHVIWALNVGGPRQNGGMNSIAAALEKVGDDLAGVVEAAFADDGLRLRDDDEVLAALAAAGRLQRAAEALMSEAVAQVLERDDLRAHPDRVTTRHGCRNAGRADAAGDARVGAHRLRHHRDGEGRRSAHGGVDG